MATLNVVAQRRWWVPPFFTALKALVYARVVKEKHIKPLAAFIARFGVKFKAEK
ncbi:hypothetical protein ACM55O_18160 [Hafnia paralvei]|uniref:hypothetical protein n=1 Tax=Hafnia paralvei TaxID=546367 RepID=UPI0039FD13DD